MDDAELRKCMTHMMNMSQHLFCYDVGSSGSLLCAREGVTYFIIRISSFLYSLHTDIEHKNIDEFHMPLIMWGEEKH